MSWEKIHPKDIKVGDYVTWAPRDDDVIEECEVIKTDEYAIHTKEKGGISWDWDSSVAYTNSKYYIWRGPLPGAPPAMDFETCSTRPMNEPPITLAKDTPGLLCVVWVDESGEVKVWKIGDESGDVKVWKIGDGQ
jgi:hypothetical protein